MSDVSGPGVAVGAAIMGRRPILVLRFQSFLWLAASPIVNYAAKADIDLIVVGTKDGLTMVEAGADEVPESLLLEALEIAHAEIRKLCDAQEELRAEAGKAKWLDTDLSA